MPDVFLADCAATFKSKPHYANSKRLFSLQGRLIHPTHKELATLTGYIFSSRDDWRLSGDFWEMSDALTREILEFSTTVFNNDTILHPWLKDGGRRSGSRCWSDELNKGDIIYLVDLKVKDEFRRHGLGSMLLQKFLESQNADSHVFCWPSPLTADSGSVNSVNQENVVAFYQKNGFRRIGRTAYLCCSLDPLHPSRNIDVVDDPSPFFMDFKSLPPMPTFDEMMANGFPDPEEHDRVMSQRYPIHTAIAGADRREIVKLIKFAHAVDPFSIRKVSDVDGATPILVAVRISNVAALRTLLELGAGDDLNATNLEGETPLEALNQNMTFARVLDGSWRGHPQDMLSCEYLIKKALIMPLNALSEADYINKRKLGCSCGQCTEGWFSPRMRYRLRVTGKTLADSKTPYPDVKSDQLKFGRYLQKSLPTDSVEFWTSWHSILSAIFKILKSANHLPTPERLSSHSDARDFVSRGGDVRTALNALTSIAKMESSLGNGKFETDHSKQYAKFPSCENDMNFGFVRRTLGIYPQLSAYSAVPLELISSDEDSETDEGVD